MADGASAPEPLDTTAPDPLDALGLVPLSARSALLSLLLGTHPAEASARSLVRLGEVFSFSEGSVRVALSRMAADGDVLAADGRYRLSESLSQRQSDLDLGRNPQLRRWGGRWELAVIETDLDPAATVEVEAALTRLRLAPWRPGVWLRPANLARAWPAELARSCLLLPAGPTDDPAGLAERLWDLPGWSARAEQLGAALTGAGTPALHFVVAAAVARHLRDDPMLPAALVPAGWPGPRLRAAYRRYEAELGRLLEAAG